jgi:ABC-type transporter Mla subunit MlaD
VESVFLDEDNRVRVNFKLFGQYADRMREGTTARVLRPVVGTTALVLMLGPGTGELIPKGGLLPSTGDGAVAGLDALIEEAIRLVGDLQNPKGDLMQTLANVNVATSSLARSMTTGNSSLRMLLEKRDLYDQLISATKHMDGLLSALNESTPDIQDAIIEARRGLEEVNRVVLALQKSIFLRGNIENYLKEDSTLIYEARP